MKQSKRWLKGGAGADVADVAGTDNGETADAIYFISSSPIYNFLSNFAYCRFKENDNTFISMEQYFMYQKAKLFDESQSLKILKITTDVDNDGLHLTAANADVVLTEESLKNNTQKLAKANSNPNPNKPNEISKLTEEVASSQNKLTEAQIKLGKAKQQVSNPTSIDNKNDVIILGKYAQLLGRQVKDYDESIWLLEREGHMRNGLRLKFTQNPELREKLIATGNKTLYEANKYDGFWGIKFDIKDAQKPGNKLNYGKNMLGKLLMVVREEL